MTTDPKLDPLREAFASRDGKGGDAPCPDPQTVWRAARADLPMDERWEVMRHLRECPSCCADWRIALEGEEKSDSRVVTGRFGGSNAIAWRWAGLAAAALVTMALVLVVWQRPGEQPAPSFRIAGEMTIESLVVEGGLPRDAFVLRWSPVGENPRYLLEVTRPNLDPVVRATDLVEAEYLVPAQALVGVEDGEALAWRVEARLMDGTVVASPAFFTTIRSD